MDNFFGYVNSLSEYIAVGSDDDFEVMEDNGNVFESYIVSL